MIQEELNTVFLGHFTDYKDRYYRICCGYAANEDDAKDLLQETFANIWKSLPTFKGESKLSTWAYRVALNTCLQHRVKEHKRRRDHVSLDHRTLFQPVGEPDPRTKQLRSCIQELSHDEKTIVLLFLEEVKYREISEILGISENLVAVKMKRIREKLKTCINSKEP